MHRRTFLATTAAAALIASPALSIGVDYTPGLVAAELKAGKTVFLDFAASWCSTCARQHRVITGLLAANPAYEANVSFIRVDWDDYGNAELARSLNIPRRSTLVVLKGDRELGRIVAGTSQRDIQNLMNIALTAATA